jgi:hypothetical protein
MIGYYFIQNKYIFVGNKDKDRDTDINGNDKYTKEMTAQLAQKGYQVPSVPLVHPVPPADLQLSSIKESFDTEEDENENLIHNNKNKISYYKSIFKRYLFL